MNRDQIQGEWKQLKGHVKDAWGKLTDDDVARIEGNFDKLAGKIQERYGVEREEAERQINEWNTKH